MTTNGNPLQDLADTAPWLVGVAGLGSAFVSAWRARKTVPAEKDSIIVNGAETAVVALQAVLKAETERADRAEAKVAALEKRLDELQRALDEARAEIHNFLMEYPPRLESETT